MRVAIIGAGVSGLVAAHLLHREHDVTIFEAADRPGGHSDTVAVVDGGRTIPIDMGFIVYNERTYPNFCRLLAQLQVPTQPSDMSFAVSCRRSGVEWNGNSLHTLVAQRRNLLRPRFLRMVADALRFNRAARRVAKRVAAGAAEERTLREFLDAGAYSRAFREWYLTPMGAAIWSAVPAEFDRIALRFLAAFLENHGMLNLWDRPRWRTITGGSREYVRRLVAPFAERLRLATPVGGITRDAGGVTVTALRGAAERFDHVLIATHADDALRLLGAGATAAEREVLGAIPYQVNETVLHTDAALLPRLRRVWASWNYLVPAEPIAGATLTYYMNLLQSLPTETPYCVTLNHTAAIDPARIVRRVQYAHPVFTLAGARAQARHAEISGQNRTHYCGAYWGNGFHEDGVRSALRAAGGLVRLDPGWSL